MRLRASRDRQNIWQRSFYFKFGIFRDNNMTYQTILWRRLDRPGHEAARLWSHASSWHLAGTAVFAYDQQPCRLDYHLICDANWNTRSGLVTGWVGDEALEFLFSVGADRRWQLNDRVIFEVSGCYDIDLNFSPSTNLLPIRRLDLAVGQAATVKAAWLRFPGFNFEPLEQTYRRLDLSTYRYESAGGRFIRELTVNAAGFVTSYPDFWALEPDL
jgi:hypothetical protein